MMHLLFVGYKCRVLLGLSKKAYVDPLLKDIRYSFCHKFLEDINLILVYSMG